MFEESVKICNEGLKKVCDNTTVGAGEEVSTNHQTRETPIFNHVIPLVSPIVNPMVICPFVSPFVNPRSTLTAATNPVTRISSSSSKVSDV